LQVIVVNRSKFYFSVVCISTQAQCFMINCAFPRNKRNVTMFKQKQYQSN